MVALIFFITFAGAALLLIIMLYSSWLLAVKEEKKRLEAIGINTLDRANFIFSQANTILDQLNTTTLKPCSPEHLYYMRKLVMKTRSIDEIGYFENNILKCTSWGKLNQTVAIVPAVYTLPTNSKISTNIKAIMADKTLMLGVSKQNYNVLINPELFFEIFFDNKTQIALVTPKKDVLAQHGKPNMDHLNYLFSLPSGYITSQSSVIFVKKNGFIALVIGPASNLQAKLQHERWLLLPFAFILVVMIIALVIFFIKRRLSLLGELTLAVNNHEFVVYYQPIVDLKTGRCVGAEALVKWERPNGELIQPDFFIPLAEESKLILPITDQVVRSTVREMKNLLLADPSLHIAINLSVDDIHTGRILKVINQALENTGIKKNQIWLEATERGFMKLESALKTLKRAQKLGYIIAIDDFGTGYSSLSTLQNFPLNILKIDKSFIDRIGTDTVISNVTPHIIDIAKTLNLTVVAEGIEHAKQAEYLLQKDVTYGQGWLFSKALKADEFIEYYKKNCLLYNIPLQL